jgi:hypothetical protein
VDNPFKLALAAFLEFLSFINKLKPQIMGFSNSYYVSLSFFGINQVFKENQGLSSKNPY